MLGLLLFLASATPTDSAEAAAELSRGASLYRVCQAEAKLMDPSSLPTAAEMDIVNGAYCVGYLNGFTSGLHHASSSICMHDESMATLVRVYIDFMDRNPRLLGEEKATGLRLALRDAYPCPANLQSRPLAPSMASRKSL